MLALAQTYSNGDINDEAVQGQFRQISNTLKFEASYEKPSFIKQFLSSASTRKRVYLACSVAVFCMLSGNNVSNPLYRRVESPANKDLIDHFLLLRVHVD